MNDNATMPLELVPVELLKRIAAFLPYQDALRFSRSNRQLYELLSMSTIRLPSPLVSGTVWHGHFQTGDVPQWSRSLPILLKNRVHTAVLEGRWKDQGWGNSKGKLYVVATSTIPNNQTSRLVVTSPTAPHSQGNLHVEFNIHEDECYSLWYSAGGGGGHSLYIAQLRMKIFLYDMGRHSLSRNFHAMEQRGALLGAAEQPFHFRMLQCVARTLLQQLERNEMPDINMASFFESTGIEICEESLLALEQIASSFLEQQSTGEYDDAPSEEELDATRQQAFPRPPVAVLPLPVPQENNNAMVEQEEGGQPQPQPAPPEINGGAMAFDPMAAEVGNDVIDAEWMDMMEGMSDEDQDDDGVVEVVIGGPGLAIGIGRLPEEGNMPAPQL